MIEEEMDKLAFELRGLGTYKNPKMEDHEVEGVLTLCILPAGWIQVPRTS